jgi:small redox-active disulfide protein 2
VKRPLSPCDAALEVTQISLGKFKVGITGLTAAIEEVKSLGERPDQEIAQALFERLKPRNYIPAGAVVDYKRAFLREFKKALGEKVAEEELGLVIKILGPGCPNCHRLEQMVLELLSELGLAAQVEFIKDINDITAHGVFATPALIINNRVRVMGQLPTREALKQYLSELQEK